MQYNLLKTDIKFLKGVGESRAKILSKELDINSFEDLIYYFPYKYIDRTRFYRIDEITPYLSYVQLKGKITRFITVGEKNKQRLTANFTDGTSTIELIWFRGLKWIKQNLKVNKEYVVFGKPSKFHNEINLVHPEVEEAGQDIQSKINSSLEAAYNTTEAMKRSSFTSKAIHKLLYNLFLAVKGRILETLPPYLLEQLRFMPFEEALKNLHFPENSEKLKQATLRLKFDELFFIQLDIVKAKALRQRKLKGYIFSKVGDYFNKFYKENLPFELTNAQKRVLKEIRKDLGNGTHTNRLLQGDVGSGKTLVALMAMLIALDNDFQTCMMAPTEILANQHFETVKEMLSGLDINIRLLTGSSKTKERRIIHEELLSGELHILIGTHALLEDVVQFKNLGLVIIDEQHRFGVVQRSKMWKKNKRPPHVVVMTATPIPRTLSMTLYGDLEVSVIDELPPGRKKIATYHAFDSKRLRVFGFMKEQIKKGRQIYIVYPLIKESEKFDYKDLEDGLESISSAFPPPEYAISVVHGQMKADEKERAMQLFAKGQTQIMIATTVIEVGVNVPNASVMIIESAEKFGLSQLHQLRGRVGRGADQSYCILMSSYKLSKDAKKRIETMVQTNDGFEIAEVDLRLRGPGDMEGTQQSGVPMTFKIANLAQDGQLLQYARQKAIDILTDDPDLSKPENAILLKGLEKLRKDNASWGLVS